MLDEFLQSGNNFQGAIINALRRLEAELVRQRPVQGGGIRLQRTPSGTVIEAEPHVQPGCNMPAAAAAAQTIGPFRMLSADKAGLGSEFKGFQVTGGTVNNFTTWKNDNYRHCPVGPLSRYLPDTAIATEALPAGVYYLVATPNGFLVRGADDPNLRYYAVPGWFEYLIGRFSVDADGMPTLSGSGLGGNVSLPAYSPGPWLPVIIVPAISRQELLISGHPLEGALFRMIWHAYKREVSGGRGGGTSDIRHHSGVYEGTASTSGPLWLKIQINDSDRAILTGTWGGSGGGYSFEVFSYYGEEYNAFGVVKLAQNYPPAPFVYAPLSSE